MSPFTTSAAPSATNVAPQAPAAVVCANCSNELDRDLPSSLAAVTAIHDKDTRAYEVNRQRAHKAEDQARAKGRKDAKLAAKAALAARPIGLHHNVKYTASSASACSCGGGNGRESKGSRRLDRRDLKASWDQDMADDASSSPIRTPGSSPMLGLRVSRGMPPAEVNLTDLFGAAKKPRKSKAGDFEVIPKVRTVIALDDTSEDDMLIDEPWEHITSTDSEGRPSYAAIMAGK